MATGGKLSHLIANSGDPPAIAARLRYGSFVCSEHRLFYMETPKAACTAVKWILAHVTGFDRPCVWVDGRPQLEMCIHQRSYHPLPSLLDINERDADEILFGGGYLRFCVVRNPYSRLLSCWSNKIRQGDPLFLPVNLEVNRFCGRETDANPCAFREFAQWVLATNDPLTCDVHWRAQKRLLLPDLVPYDRVMRAERLGGELADLFASNASLRAFDAGELLRRYNFNKSLPLAGEPLFDEDLAARVFEFYKDDFTTYGYDVDSWRRLNARSSTIKEMETVALAHIRRRNLVIKHASAEVDALRNQQAAAAKEIAALREQLGAAAVEIAALRGLTRTAGDEASASEGRRNNIKPKPREARTARGGLLKRLRRALSAARASAVGGSGP